ncbi:hypothetical protein [Fluviicola taffensis]|uniref:hypothetical protein n=1 Tax=Fluviicola taffensis TaxID=191579 RepID=UPI003137A70F
MKVLYLLLILVVVGTGCEKYNLKQPAYLGLNWRFHSTCNSMGNVTIDKGFFYSKEFTVSGTRQKGSAVEITKSLPVQKVQFSIQDDLGISLDVPMGDYIEFSLNTIIDKSNNPSIRLEGTYTKGTEVFPLVIEWADTDVLNFKVLNPFSLKKKKNYKIFIGFDVAKLFLNVSTNVLSSSPTYNENGVPTKKINSVDTPILFNQINEQLPNALLLTVE